MSQKGQFFHKNVCKSHFKVEKNKFPKMTNKHFQLPVYCKENVYVDWNYLYVVFFRSYYAECYKGIPHIYEVEKLAPN